MGGESSALKRLKESLRGHCLWPWILRLCDREGKVYAYALHENLEKEFNIKASKILVYVVLYKLESDGLLKSEFEERRKYYTLTKKGGEHLEQARLELKKALNSLEAK